MCLNNNMLCMQVEEISAAISHAKASEVRGEADAGVVSLR
jgi:hypothetical protein